MPRRLSLAVFLVWATFNWRAFGQPCLCSALRPAGLQVNCSSLNLADLPRLPADTTELHVRDNRLTSVSPGLFDRLVALERVSLAGNPFHCDCGIQYLRNWLLKNRDVVSAEPTCASPSPVARMAVADLGDDHFASCAAAAGCGPGAYGAVMGGMVCCLIVLLLRSLRLAKRTTFTLEIYERHSGFEADSLRSLKPRHRRRLHREPAEVTREQTEVTAEAAEDLEEQLIHMELLPQVLDTLHRKHNIKMKAN